MKKTLPAFTLIEVLVTLTMISFLTVTGLTMSHPYFSSFRFWRFQASFSEYLYETEQMALAEVSFSEADRLDNQWHLYGELSDGELSLSRFESFSHLDNPEMRIVGFLDSLELDHFPLVVSDLFLKSDDDVVSGVVFMMTWTDSISQWQFSLLQDSFSPLSEGFEFSIADPSCSLSEFCQLEYQVRESGGVGYRFLLSSLGKISREALLSF
jgi:hypothetical protein